MNTTREALKAAPEFKPEVRTASVQTTAAAGGDTGSVTGSKDVWAAPAFHALSVLRADDRPRVRPVTALGGGIVGLIFVDQHRIVLASQRPWEQRLPLTAWSPPCTRRRRLRAAEVGTAAATLAWWNEAEHVPLDPEEHLVLAPFELTELLGS